MAPLNGSVAPVCPISRSQVLPGQPGIMQPYIPRAVDLPSAIAAANQINRIVQSTLSPGLQPNNVPTLGTGAGIGTSGGASGVKKIIDRWQEKKRTTDIIRFYAKDENGVEDKDQWLEVERIAYIKWHDTVQKIDLIFEWPYDPSAEGNSKLMKTTTTGS